MNYIDKIKKNGVIYAIRGTSSGSSGGSASEAETAQGVTLTYEPDEKTGIQVLDKHYGLGAVDTITWTRPAISRNDFMSQEQPLLLADGEESEEETISCPLVYTDTTHDIAVYLGSPFVQLDSCTAGIKLLLLVGGSFLLDVGVVLGITDGNVDVFALDVGDKLNAIFDYLTAIGDGFNDLYGYKNPIRTFNAGQNSEEEGGGVIKGAKNADGEDESFEPNVKNLAHMLRDVAALHKVTSLGDSTQIINYIVDAMSLTNAAYLSSLAGITASQMPIGPGPSSEK